ncbi:MAG: nucleotidyl transferase AbiEii/AbiGii toxin family protein [Fibrobacter sp.]|uniref:nucleotidyl transferase AbiEii/AbiGii toxin family protein n=1 Tax=Fibrobacter sp. TaxID=35828 RepID=UPI0025B8A8AC|nr:nucleotidyl transferase AbiEii/AbiGii toxin family protein [Fibrobacter sp.]MBQ9226836.1 nucleotidyl transferase AbiEii/AbiGii toxin family protein [Fibrobacter sp.]
MITKNEMQLKALVKDLSAKYGITPQATLQMYCLERLLDRIAASRFRNHFIIKGGFLIASILGVGSRSTMDIDATVKGFSVSYENVDSIFKEICGIDIADQLTFSFERIEEIREKDDYLGLRVFVECRYGKMNVPLTVDLTTGDTIIPHEIEYMYKCVFDDKMIPIIAYPLENVFAEKLDTIISRGVANTRTRDFYDVYTLYALKKEEVNFETLRLALEATSRRRNTFEILKEYPQVLEDIKADSPQNDFWRRFVTKNPFAKGITLPQVLDCAKEILDLTEISRLFEPL